MTAGRFITLEGGEGAGKSTQLRRLAETLAKSGFEVVTTREPGGSPSAEKIRGLLLDPAARWEPAAEALLHFAARSDHYTTVIAPALRRGAWVVCDRFADSTRAYQGYGLGLDAAVIETLYEITLGDFAPDLTLVLDLPVETGMERIRRREGMADRYERMDRAFHERLRRGFLDIAARNPERCTVIDADADPDTVFSRIMGCVGDRLGIAVGAS
jgi:dTMP kinase